MAGRHLEEDTFLQVVRTADVLLQRAADLLKGYDLSLTQYNVLRILRGAGADGLACSQISERMITRDPDITRLLDRLEARGLVARERSTKDRRVVVTTITQEGLDLVSQLDEPVADLHRRQLGPLGEQKLRQLGQLLELVREPR
jgi:DNA-binding MarR family transcriptional regulator